MYYVHTTTSFGRIWTNGFNACKCNVCSMVGTSIADIYNPRYICISYTTLESGINFIYISHQLQLAM